MPNIFDIFDVLYREFCRARLAEMRAQLLLWPGPALTEKNCEAGHPDDVAGRKRFRVLARMGQSRGKKSVLSFKCN